jgi:FkbH-like protein
MNAALVKCLVWDLDHTLWDGILLEDGHVSLRPRAREVLETLDQRGILHAVASKNDDGVARAKLAELGVDDFFLQHRIGWGPKSDSIKSIAESLNIGIDSLAFIDDQPFERDEVRFHHPSVRLYDASNLEDLASRPEMQPPFITEDARRRRLMYRADAARKAAEDGFGGPAEAFLATLDMVLRIQRAREEDLQRAEELTIRTHQLNTTGYTYSYDELDALRRSRDHLLLVAELEDRHGTYGKIGLVLVELSADTWNVKLLLMSCRVASRGVGAALMTHLRQQARSKGVRLRAEFVANDRNRMMYVTYKFNGFREVHRDGAHSTLECDLSTVPDYPTYLRVEVERT